MNATEHDADRQAEIFVDVLERAIMFVPSNQLRHVLAPVSHFFRPGSENARTVQEAIPEPHARAIVHGLLTRAMDLRGRPASEILMAISLSQRDFQNLPLPELAWQLSPEEILSWLELPGNLTDHGVLHCIVALEFLVHANLDSTSATTCVDAIMKLKSIFEFIAPPGAYFPYKKLFPDMAGKALELIGQFANCLWNLDADEAFHEACSWIYSQAPLAEKANILENFAAAVAHTAPSECFGRYYRSLLTSAASSPLAREVLKAAYRRVPGPYCLDKTDRFDRRRPLEELSAHAIALIKDPVLWGVLQYFGRQFDEQTARTLLDCKSDKSFLLELLGVRAMENWPVLHFQRLTLERDLQGQIVELLRPLAERPITRETTLFESDAHGRALCLLCTVAQTSDDPDLVANALRIIRSAIGSSDLPAGLTVSAIRIKFAENTTPLLESTLAELELAASQAQAE